MEPKVFESLTKSYYTKGDCQDKPVPVSVGSNTCITLSICNIKKQRKLPALIENPYSQNLGGHFLLIDGFLG